MNTPLAIALGALVTVLAAGCGDDAAVQESTSGVLEVCVAPGEGLVPEGIERADHGRVKPYRYCDRMNSTGELWDWPVDASPPPELGDTITDPKSSGPLMVFGPPTRTDTTPPVQ